jgi:hypothetical protein
MRSIVLLCVTLLTLGAGQPAISAKAPADVPAKLDHVLLWGRSIDEVTAILAVKLGFQVRPATPASFLFSIRRSNREPVPKAGRECDASMLLVIGRHSTKRS